MTDIEELRTGIKNLIATPQISLIARVKSVDEGKATCVLVDQDGQEILDVRLRPVLSGNKSALQIPKTGSFVLCLSIENTDEWMVVGCDEIEKISFETAGARLEIAEQIRIEGGGKNLLNLMEKLFSVIESGYVTNNGQTLSLKKQAEFSSLKTEFKRLLK